MPFEYCPSYASHAENRFPCPFERSTVLAGCRASVNRVILTGRLVATPELRTTGSGLHVATVRNVTSDRKQPEFHDVVLWRQMAAFATTYMAKGCLAYVEARLQSRTWEAADGSKRRTVEVVAGRFQARSCQSVKSTGSNRTVWTSSASRPSRPSSLRSQSRWPIHIGSSARSVSASRSPPAAS